MPVLFVVGNRPCPYHPEFLKHQKTFLEKEDKNLLCSGTVQPIYIPQLTASSPQSTTGYSFYYFILFLSLFFIVLFVIILLSFFFIFLLSFFFTILFYHLFIIFSLSFFFYHSFYHSFITFSIITFYSSSFILIVLLQKFETERSVKFDCLNYYTFPRHPIRSKCQPICHISFHSYNNNNHRFIIIALF